jgi:hypothetical protein
MQKFLKNFLYLISFCFIACAPGMFQSLKPAGDAYRHEQVRLFTNDTSESMVYKTNLEFRDHSFSSLLYLKKSGNDTFALVLMTNFGNTMLEGTFSKDEFIFKNVVPDLNRKPLLDILENDWRMLLRGNLFTDMPQIFSSDELQTVYHFKDGKTDNLYYYSSGKESVEMIESYSGEKKKVIIHIDRMNPKNPEAISIEHPGMDLKIEMVRLKNATDDSME